MKRIAVILFSLMCGGLLGSPVRSSLGADRNKGEGRLPYVSEVEYIQSTGTQFIDTGLKASNATFIQAKVAWMEMGMDKVAFGIDNGSTFNGGFILQVTNGGTEIRFIRGNQFIGVRVPPNGSYPQVDTFYDISVGPSGVEVNGTLTPITDTSAFTTTGNIPLFGWRRAANMMSPYGTVKIAYLRIYDGSNLVRDYVPVRFTNELFQDEGAMFDKVSGTLFSNAGTGSFIIGPDK